MTISPKENLLRAIWHREPEYVPYLGECVCSFVDHRGRRPPQDGVDEWGVTWIPLPDGYEQGAEEPLSSYPSGYPATDVAELVNVAFPDGSDPALYEGLLAGVNAEQTLIIGRHPTGPLERFTVLLGPAQAWLALGESPKASQCVLERIIDYHVQIAQGYVSAGVEAGWLADDYAGQSGPLVSPIWWRKAVLPGLARIIGVYRAAGLPVFFHTCGEASAFVPDLVEAGVTMFNLQSAVCDLESLKTRFGRRIGFIGGVSADLMLRGAPEDVCLAARQAILVLGREGGLILGPDQFLAFPTENEAAVWETARRYGQYPIADGNL